MIKLVVSDLDGTLLPYGDNRISQKNLDKVDALLAKKVYFAISSGRVYSELIDYLPDFFDRIYFISSDGALVTFGNKIIFHKQFSSDALSFAINSSHGVTLAFFGRDKVYSFNDTALRFPNAVNVLKPFDIKEPIYKIVSFGTPIKNFEGIYSRIHYSDGLVSEYVPPYANKGVALGALQRHLGVSMYETLAMGDSINDIPMMKNAKYSHSIGSSTPRLLSECRFHSDSVDTVLEKVWINQNFE